MGEKRLAPVQIAFNWTSLVGAFEGALRALGDAPDTAQLMGVTGHAFRFALAEENGVVGGGPAAAAVDFRRALPLYRNAGRKLELVESAAGNRDFAKRREKALKSIRKNIDRGRPAVAYDLHIPEFGIIYGYDDRAQTLTVSSLMSGQYGGTLLESRWPVPERGGRLVVLLVGEREKVKTGEVLRAALRFAVEYAERGDPGDPTGATHGLAAYARWREAFARGQAIDPGGHAHTIQTVQTARRDAARFLRATAPSVPPAAGAALSEAAAAYDRIALAFSRMATLFPYPAGGDVTGQGARLVAVGALREAEAGERAAVGKLAEAVRLI